MKIGYARVSTRDQNLELQLDALTKADCETVYREKVSGASANRPELERLLTQLRTGDTVCLYKLERLGRSRKHLPTVVGDLQQMGVGLVSLTDAINTTSDHGRLVFNLFASLAEFKHGLTRERTGIIAETLYREQQLGVNEIAQRLNISKATLYKYLRHRQVVIHTHQKAAIAKTIDYFWTKRLTKATVPPVLQGGYVAASQI